MRVVISMPGVPEGNVDETVDLENSRARQLIRDGYARQAEAVRSAQSSSAPKRRTRKANS